jgi:hypothetical protein
MGSQLRRADEGVKRFLPDASCDPARGLDRRPGRTLLAAIVVLLVLSGPASAAAVSVAASGAEPPGWAPNVCVLSLRGTPQSLNPSTASANRLRERHRPAGPPQATPQSAAVALNTATPPGPGLSRNAGSATRLCDSRRDPGCHSRSFSRSWGGRDPDWCGLAPFDCRSVALSPGGCESR